MYVHIGDNKILNSKEMIGVFDVDTLKQSRNNLRVLNLLKSEKNDIKSVIFMNKKGKDQEVFSSISPQSLKKRLEWSGDFSEGMDEKITKERNIGE